MSWRNHWARYATKGYRNYGTYSSGRVESTASSLQRYLDNRLGDLWKLYESILKTVKVGETTFHQKCAVENRRAYTAIETIPCLKPLSHRIARKPIKKVHKQHRMALDELKAIETHGERRRSTCMGQFRRQRDLSCRHEILNVLETAADDGTEPTLSTDQIGFHWHLEAALVVRAP
ncbi:hypothetical protein K470DRAFT_258580 [Piedraia hortae CBS 480.64]|uniref:Uncharacterized protein n=1 Tax=Piedraia hortae CBS 480.64 TaxID=1314780 RepID=A0A6A7BYE4_9PEZI|nr:hypothetical protein K470DRAFT_258580 [Piedraia hortae CBS 480.64]